LLRRAIRSVLNQTYPGFRLCIYDNASGDQTEAVVREFQRNDSRVEYIQRPSNIGAFANWVDAASRVGTPYFSFLPDDDLMLPHFFDVALAGFSEQPEAALSLLATLHMSPRGFIRYGRILRWPKDGLLMPPEGMLCCLRHGTPVVPAMLMRREIWAQFSGFDEATDPLCDIDFELRVMAQRPVWVSRQPGAIQLMHDGAATARADLDWIWPRIPRIIHKLQEMDLPPDARCEAVETLTRWMKKGLLVEGVALSAVRGRWKEAAKATELLSDECGLALTAKLSRAAIAMCRDVPGALSILKALLAGKTLARTLSNLDLQWRWRTYAATFRSYTCSRK
jgi:GT2 family glycosyltransferase